MGVFFCELEFGSCRLGGVGWDRLFGTGLLEQVVCNRSFDLDRLFGTGYLGHDRSFRIGCLGPVI